MGVLGGLILKQVGVSNILLTNLLSYYDFDEPSGNLLDIHSTHDFTLVGPPTQGATGKINDAYSFNGSTDYCNSIDSNPWDIKLNDFSVSTWFKRTATGVNSYIFDSRVNTNNGFGFGPWSTDQILVSFKNQDLFYGDVSDTDWHHVAIVRDADDVLTVYLDNVNEGTMINVTDTGNLIANPRIGARSFTSPTTKMDGLIDEFGIWDRVLTSDEIALLYNSGSGLSYISFG